MDFRYEADMLRSLAKIVERGHLSRGVKPVHWCFDCGSALAEAEIEYADKARPRSTSRIWGGSRRRSRRHSASRCRRVSTSPCRSGPPRRGRCPPASRHAGPELDYVLVEGPRAIGKRTWLVLAEALAEKHSRATASRLRRARPRAGRRPRRPALQHPFYDREIPLILGEHVSAEDGTGAVHTAPGHGQEDFAVGLRYGPHRPVHRRADESRRRARRVPAVHAAADGVTLAGPAHLEGERRDRRGAARTTAALLAHFTLTHSYPHCWRHKTPVAFRATPQWFISMEQAACAATRCRRSAKVQWFPDWGEARIYAMVEGRPDWCISRQRTWGVPIALFIDRETASRIRDRRR
jgi:isoleucyl-tRNA synthetase